jgi:hypothetical protein
MLREANGTGLCERREAITASARTFLKAASR